MIVTIKYFGSIAEDTGMTEEELNLKDTIEIAELKTLCVEKYHLKDDESIQLAVNQELNKKGVIKDGDEVAFLPPFAGG